MYWSWMRGQLKNDRQRGYVYHGIFFPHDMQATGIAEAKVKVGQQD